MSNVAIRAQSLSKCYRIGGPQVAYRTLRDTLADALTGPLRRFRASLRSDGSGSDTETFWALKDVSFDVAHGEVVGVIGANGAGKSTLLKILSRITDPTEGFALIYGRVGSLLEVGTGFHAELTGRENIQLSGAILGMTRAEIARKFDEIVAFAEVDRFIDTPVKHYSSGMYLRLAFAVAAHLDPEILLVDEVLAVGDAAFQRKCLGKMQEVGESGRTVLFVSHDMTAMMRLASRSVLLERGAVRFIGPTNDAIRLYSEQPARTVDIGARRDRSGDGSLRVQSIRFRDARRRLVSTIGSCEPVTIEMSYRSEIPNLDADDLRLHIRFTDALGQPVTTFSTRFHPLTRMQIGREGTFVCYVPSLALAADTYSVDFWVDYRGTLADRVIRTGEIHVGPSDHFKTGSAPIRWWNGAAIILHEWSAVSERTPESRDERGDMLQTSNESAR